MKAAEEINARVACYVGKWIVKKIRSSTQNGDLCHKTYFVERWPFPWVILNRNMFNIQSLYLQDGHWNWSLFRVTNSRRPRILQLVFGGMHFCYRRRKLLVNLEDHLWGHIMTAKIRNSVQSILTATMVNLDFELGQNKYAFPRTLRTINFDESNLQVPGGEKLP